MAGCGEKEKESVSFLPELVCGDMESFEDSMYSGGAKKYMNSLPELIHDDLIYGEDIIRTDEKEYTSFLPDIAYGDWEDYDESELPPMTEECKKFQFVGVKESISVLSSEYQNASTVLVEKIKVIDEQYSAFRRALGDGNCFFRSFMFSYLEHILESQDIAEVDRMKAKVEECRKTLTSLGHKEFTFEEYFASFLKQLESVVQGNENSISHDEFIVRIQDQALSNYAVMFFRFVTSAEIRKRSEFFEPFILGLENKTVEQFCKLSVDPMGEESDHVHITALSDALGIPIRVVHLDQSTSDTAGGVIVNHHDFIPNADDIPDASVGSSGTRKPFITLLYRPGHYDILYPK